MGNCCSWGFISEEEVAAQSPSRWTTRKDITTPKPSSNKKIRCTTKI